MTWVLAILIVLALGGVAVVAAGRGSPMAPAWDDRPDATVPAEGPLSADDLRRVRFSLAFRGYRMSEVDALLDRLASVSEEAERGTSERPSEPAGSVSEEAERGTSERPSEQWDTERRGRDAGPGDDPPPTAGRGDDVTG